MVRLALTAALWLAAPAGSIFGDLRLGEKYLTDVPVQLTCGTESAETRTDSTGSYRLSVKTGGRCRLSVTYEKQAASLDVVVFDKPAQYRLMLEMKDGKLSLKRV